MKQMLEGDGVILFLLTSLTYMKRSGGVFKSCSSFKHWTHMCIEHHRQLPNECHWKEKQIKNKIKKMESEYRHQKTLPEEQTRGSGSTWSWFTWMTTIMEGSAKGDCAPGGVDQGAT